MLFEQFFAPVLVVDDEPLILREVAGVVKAFGYFDVREAGSYRQAEAVLAESRIVALITDIALPDGDGRRLALEALRKNPGLRVVLMTGFPSRSIMLPAELRGNAHFLEKPFGSRELQALLNDIQDGFETSITCRPD